MQITPKRKDKKKPKAKPAGSRWSTQNKPVDRTGLVPSSSVQSSFTYTPQNTQPIVLGDGLVVLRSFLTIQQQQTLIDEAMVRGKHEEGAQSGFYEIQGENQLKLNQGNRGRVIRPVHDFPPQWTDYSMQIQQQAATACPSLRCDFKPTTCLLNFYNEKGTFKWHRDSENPTRLQTKTPRPIISLTVGDACDFGYKLDYESPEHETVRLNSGDALVFGGPHRMMVHSVLKIHPRSKPTALRMAPGRLNITVRDVDGYEDVSQFPAYRVIYDIDEPPT
eukprot:TRINITY_DN67610_c10_g4_i1.p1 TRINITY_DN67610_c10_g4~~TRINITY_DN67610_c10_g4_i1.p1  ORF type:complete len:277 (-),score=37.87 TRINITY_DN67610_c10_g4_i1:451-1281(-)